ncbi:MAG: radical SAM protein [candidate division WOR-3 bacterium]
MKMESPDYIRISQAAAMVLGFKNGLFYRNAKSPCINILLTYENGCAGNCAYCGLSMKRPGEYREKSFIRVEWNNYPISEVIQRIKNKNDYIRRICISMITNRRAVNDTKKIIQMLHNEVPYPISVLAAPTILSQEDFLEMKKLGADRLGIAVDACTPRLFEQFRGKGVKGPHKWETYWSALQQAVSAFGRGYVGVHLIVGLGETEKEMVETIQKAQDSGIETHLFSFFPESDSILAHQNPPSIGTYRRIQLARYLINKNVCTIKEFEFDEKGRITKFNIPEPELEKHINSGKPFMTSGCPGEDGEVACNRPYSDSLPGDDIRNFPFLPDPNDIAKIKKELKIYV